jgi:hypothetical protein
MKYAIILEFSTGQKILRGFTNKERKENLQGGVILKTVELCETETLGISLDYTNGSHPIFSSE